MQRRLDALRARRTPCGRLRAAKRKRRPRPVADLFQRRGQGVNPLTIPEPSLRAGALRRSLLQPTRSYVTRRLRRTLREGCKENKRAATEAKPPLEPPHPTNANQLTRPGGRFATRPRGTPFGNPPLSEEESRGKPLNKPQLASATPRSDSAFPASVVSLLRRSAPSLNATSTPPQLKTKPNPPFPPSLRPRQPATAG